MPYTDHFRLADDLIAHLDTVMGGISDPFISSRYVGFVSIVAVTVYELAIKCVFHAKPGSWPLYVKAEEGSQFEWGSAPTLTR